MEDYIDIIFILLALVVGYMIHSKEDKNSF